MRVIAYMSIKQINNFVTVNEVSNNLVRVTMTGEIGWEISADTVMELLNTYKGYTIEADIFSFGGSAFDALAIYDFITNNKVDFQANIYGICGSAATIIACAAKRAYIGENSFYFIHNAFNAETGREDDIAKKVSEKIVGIYAKRTKKGKKWIREQMANETAYTASEAKSNGFVDGTLKERATIAASLLPIISKTKTQTTMTFIDKVKNLFGIEATTEDEVFAAIEEKVSDEGTVPETVANLQKAVQTMAGQVLALTSNHEAMEALTEKVEGYEAQINELKNTVAELKAGKTATGKDGNPFSILGGGKNDDGEALVIASSDEMKDAFAALGYKLDVA